MHQPGDSDIDRLLRAANPVDIGTLPDPSTSAEAEALYSRIVGGASERRRLNAGGWRSRVRLAAVAAVGAVAVSAGVSYALTLQATTKKSTVACFSGVQLQAKFSIVPAGRGDPVVACQEEWARGHIPGRPAANEVALAACILQTRVVAVFPMGAPAGDPCHRLKLVPWRHSATSTSTTGPGVAFDPVAAASSTISQQLTAACTSEGEAYEVVRIALARAGLSRWTVVTQAPFSTERPCASAGIDDALQMVRIIPVPPS